MTSVSDYLNPHSNAYIKLFIKYKNYHKFTDFSSQEFKNLGNHIKEEEKKVIKARKKMRLYLGYICVSNTSLWLRMLNVIFKIKVLKVKEIPEVWLDEIQNSLEDEGKLQENYPNSTPEDTRKMFPTHFNWVVKILNVIIKSPEGIDAVISRIEHDGNTLLGGNEDIGTRCVQASEIAVRAAYQVEYLKMVRCLLEKEGND